MWRKKRKEHRIFDRIMLAVFLLVASIYIVKFLIGFFYMKNLLGDLGSGFMEVGVRL
jgi:hypothetical protein